MKTALYMKVKTENIPVFINQGVSGCPFCEKGVVKQLPLMKIWECQECKKKWLVATVKFF